MSSRWSVRSPTDAKLVHEVMALLAPARYRVIAKIEKPEAVEILRPSCWPSTGSWWPCGYLGVELPLERVPLVQ